VLHEFPESCLEDPFHAACGMTGGSSALKKRVEIGPLPENILEFIALPLRLADDKQLAKDKPP
jgi:hypothetical protein